MRKLLFVCMLTSVLTLFAQTDQIRVSLTPVSNLTLTGGYTKV